MFRNEFIKYQDNLYIVKRILKAEYNPNVEAWKEQTGSDLALQKEGMVYFVELIPDLEVIPDLHDECIREK